MNSRGCRRARGRVAVRRAARPRRAADRRGGASGARRIRHAGGAGAVRRRDARRARRARPCGAKPRRPAIAPSRRDARRRGPPRMESLRFYAGRLPLPVGLMCARIASPQGRDFLVVARRRAIRARPNSRPPRPPSGRRRRAAARRRRRRRVAFCGASTRKIVSARPIARSRRRSAPTRRSSANRSPRSRARVGLDPTGDLAAAIAARRTFSALRLGWPEADRATRESC